MRSGSLGVDYISYLIPATALFFSSLILKETINSTENVSPSNERENRTTRKEREGG
jgi:hypothetical protein